MTLPSDKPTLMYVADPMCSWCWGFAPVIQALTERYASTLNIRLIMGGLRPAEAAQYLDDDLRAYLQQHWQHVHDATGQVFNEKNLKRDNWLYDTEPAARAVVTMRHIAAEHEQAFFHDLQHAYYTRGVDITQSSAYLPLLATYNVDETLFLSTFMSDATKHATRQDFALSRSLGVQGFPAVIIDNKQQLTLLTHGYQPLPRVQATLESILNPVQL